MNEAVVVDRTLVAEGGQNGSALKFLSPIKGPALEQIAVEVGSRRASARQRTARPLRRRRAQAGPAAWPSRLVTHKAVSIPEEPYNGTTIRV